MTFKAIVQAAHNGKAHSTANCISFSRVIPGTELVHIVRWLTAIVCNNGQQIQILCTESSEKCYATGFILSKLNPAYATTNKGLKQLNTSPLF